MLCEILCRLEKTQKMANANEIPKGMTSACGKNTASILPLYSTVYKECRAMVTRVSMAPNFTSSLKKVVNHYTRDEVLLQLFMDDFCLSEEESSGEEVEGTYTYLGSQGLKKCCCHHFF